MYYIHANQNSHEKSPPTGQNGHHLKYLQRIWAAEDGGKREFSYTLCGGVNGCSKEVPYQLNTQKPQDPTIPCLCSDTEKIRIHSDPCILVFRAARLTMAKLELLLAKTLAFSAQ